MTGRIGILLILIAFMHACSLSPAYLIAGRVTGDQDKIVISVPELGDRPDVIKIARETGESFGYEIIKEIHHEGSIEQGVLMRISSESALKKFMLPAGTTTTIGVFKPSQRLAENYKQKSALGAFDENIYRQHAAVHIYLDHSGLWGTGGKEEATKMLEQFKSSLLARANATTTTK